MCQKFQPRILLFIGNIFQNIYPLLIIVFCLLLFTLMTGLILSVEDPGFLREGAKPKGSANLLFGQMFPQNWTEKGHSSLAPPLDPPMDTIKQLDLITPSRSPEKHVICIIG